MKESKTKSETKKESTKDESLKTFNFTRDGVVIKAKNRAEAEKLFKERNKSSKEDK